MRQLTLLALVPVVVACGPGVPDPDAAAIDAVSPSAVCASLPGTVVRVEGTGLGPVMSDLLTAEPSFEVADVRITRSGGLDGNDDGGEAIDLLFSAAAREVSFDGGDLLFDVGPDLALTEGTYDAAVDHPETGSDVLPQAFVVTAGPELDGLTPSTVDQGSEAVLVLTGANFLDIGGSLPTVQIGPRVVRAVSASGCLPLPPEGTRLCTALEVEIDPRDLWVGTHDVALRNPEPAECLADAVLTLEVQP